MKVWLLISAVLFIALFSGAAEASEVTNLAGISARPGSGVVVEVSTCYQAVPPLGYIPLRVRIENGLDHSATWALESEMRRDYNNGTRTSGRWSFEVPGQSERDTWVLVPIAPIRTTLRGWVIGQLSMYGPEMYGRSASLSSQPPGHDGRLTVLIGSDATAIALPDKVGKEEVYVLKGAASCFSSDLRAYLGIDAVVLTADELVAMKPAVVRTLEEYVFGGGRLLVSAGNDVVPQMFGAPLESIGFGLGAVDIIDEADLAQDQSITERVESLLKPDISFNALVHEAGPMAKTYGPIAVRRGFMLVILIAFAMLIGPINVFVFARRNQRARLIWTTPLLSVTAGLALGASILAEDGVGGKGERTVLTILSPTHKAAMTYQVQAARTGLLAGRALDTPPDVHVNLLPGIANDDGKYRQDDKGHAGDWFRTRRVQAHWMFSRQASRARVTRINGTSGPPVIVSSIDGELQDVFYAADDGTYWHATAVAPGARTTMEPTNAEAFSQWRSEALDESHRLLSRVATPAIKGWFYATAADAGLGMIPSLESLQWTDVRSVWAGPVTTGAER